MRVVNILIADSATVTRVRLCRLLSELNGVRCFGCTAEREVVLRHCRRIDPDCIAIDIPIRDSSGMRVLPELRKQTPNCRIIVMSNQLTDAFRMNALKGGANLVISKAREFEAVVQQAAMMKEGQ